MIRVRTVWTGVAGAPYYSNHYFEGAAGATDAAQAVSDVVAFWTALQNNIDNNATGTVQSEVVEIDPATGDITASYATAGGVVTGTDAGDALPPQTQGLVRYQTGVYIGGRQVVGHTYVPSPPEALNSAVGLPVVTYNTRCNTAAGILVASPAVFSVWSRAHGQRVTVIGGGGTAQWAVLRSRRD
jgi:hypothetical protein